MRNDLPFAHLGILILLLLISLNLLILDIKNFYPGIFSASELNLISRPQTQPPAPSGFQPLSSSCPAGCLNLISAATASSRFGSAQSPAPPDKNITLLPKEYIIPLGSGSTSKSDWENLISTETVINPAVYGSILEAYLIISLKNPTKNGQVEARLYNVTDNNVVYGSHVVMNGQTEQTITTQKFALPSASKLYRMQLKSTLGYDASLENSRLKILAN